jgi:twitching motility protein PilT
VVITEIMVVTPAIRNLIREGKGHQMTSFLQAGGGEGMLSFDQHLAERVRQQSITFEQALSLCHSAEDLGRLSGRR